MTPIRVAWSFAARQQACPWFAVAVAAVVVVLVVDVFLAVAGR